VVKDLAVDRNLELGTWLIGGLCAELLVPVRTELGAPESLWSVAPVVWSDDEAGEISDAECSSALLKGKFHQESRASPVSFLLTRRSDERLWKSIFRKLN
jgi:hypothetical protein